MPRIARTLPTFAGGVVSPPGWPGGSGETVTIASFWVVLPASSLAVNVTVVTPTGNDDGAFVVTAGFVSTMSVAVAPPRNALIRVSVAATGPVDWTARLAGIVSTGGVVSTTLIVKEALPTLPDASVAVHVDVPRSRAGRWQPDGGKHVAGIVRRPGVGGGRGCVADDRPVRPVRLDGEAAGTLTIGAPSSCTETLNESEPVLPASHAVPVTRDRCVTHDGEH